MNADRRPNAEHLENLSADDQKSLIDAIEALFEKAIDTRSPKNRPPGKAGLRAEKGYYRLLYLLADFQQQHRSASSGNEPHRAPDWPTLASVLHQLRDIPELKAELEAGIASALDGLKPPATVDN